MSKLNFQEIKRQLNNTDFFEWNEFVNSFDFDKKYDSYYYEFIIQNKRYDGLYLSSIINLTGYLGFYNSVFFERYFKYLCHHNNFFVKDSALKYLRRQDDYFKDKNIVSKINLFLKRYLPKVKKDSSILKLEAISILIKYYQLKLNKKNEEYYYNEYIKTLKRCKTWQAIYRSKEDADSFLPFKKYKAEIIIICREKNRKYDLQIDFPN